MSSSFSAADNERLRAARQSAQRAQFEAQSEAPFDEETYLRFNPDVRTAVAAGAFRSGRDHYERYGRAEGRPYKMLDPADRHHVVVNGDLDLPREMTRPPVCAVDAVMISRSGGIFFRGWVNDAADALDSVDLYFGAWSISFDGAKLARMRRADAETALKSSAPHPYGFWGFMTAGQNLPAGQCSVVVRLSSGTETGVVLLAELVEDIALRNTAFALLGGSAYFGNHHFDAAASLGAMVGTQLVEFNKIVCRRAVLSPYVKRFGRTAANYKGSIIVCLYGRPEYLFLQNAIFARQPGIQDYEFIYVCNSPELGERLLKEAQICSLIYGLDLTVIVLNSNAGFGPANNLAASFARSGRLLFVNPDVFPHDKNWAAKHSEIVGALPDTQTNLFGVPLYYDDSSLMHGGMYFEADTMPDFSNPEGAGSTLLRVEHYGKGAPPDTAAFLQARPVPAVSGAFMSMARSWFETLDGFTQDYAFGHYEDADLCLRSRAAGCIPWLHDLKLWHLEGKGSHRLPEHEGGSILNRWLFTQSWLDTVQRDLLGPAPANLIGGVSPAEAATARVKMAAGRGRKP